jgi:hypothetical protein
MPKLLITPCRSALKTALIVAGMLSMSLACADPLKVCSDPDNMPFSKSEGSDKGLYIELAEMVGKRLGTSVEYVWWTAAMLTLHCQQPLTIRSEVQKELTHF